MSEAAWFLDEIDPETRQQAIDEAASRGLTLEDYLGEILGAPAAPAERMAFATPESGQADATSLPETTDLRPTTAPLANNAEGFAVRHRLEALERRVGHAVAGLDNAINALDSAMFGLASRLDANEAGAATAAATAQQTLQDLSVNVVALRKRWSDTEAGLSVLAEAQEAARRGLDQRCDLAEARLHSVEQIARAAERAAAHLAEAQESLQRAVAADLAALTRAAAAQLDAGLAEVRAAAEAAAENVDLALAHVVHEMRDLRQSLEDRLAESAAETRARVQAAFADASKRMGALTERLNDQDRTAKRTAEQLRAQIAEVETGAHAGLEQTAATLRLADTALAAELARASEAARAASEALEARMDAVEREHHHLLGHVQTIDSAVSSIIGEVIDVREAVQLRGAEADAAQRQAQARQDERLGALSTALSAGQAELAQVRAQFAAELERVEACALAGLEKQARNLAGFDADLDAKLARAALTTDKLIEDVQARLESELLGLRDQQHGLQKRMGQLETIERPLDRAFAQRLSALENDTSAAPAIDSLQRRLAEVVQRLDTLPVEQIAGKLDAAATGADRAQQRIDRVELDLSDLKLASLSAREMENLLPELTERIADLEQRQAEALDHLRDEIAGFIDANDQRLGALEHGGGPQPSDDLIAAFEALRQRIEDRVLGVEQRSVRALAQVAETITAIEHRLGRAAGSVR